MGKSWTVTVRDDQAIISMADLEQFIMMRNELHEIDPEERLNNIGRCILGCRGHDDWDENGDGIYVHGVQCPFRIADTLTQEAEERHTRV